MASQEAKMRLGPSGPEDVNANLKTTASFSVLKVARLLGQTESRLLGTERDLLPAVRDTIQLTEAIIKLVRSATATTQALMAPAPAAHCAGYVACACDRVAVAKCFVKVVEELNQAAGHMNQVTACMIKLSSGLAPREEDCVQGDCISYLLARADAARSAATSLSQVEALLKGTARNLEEEVADPRLAAQDASIPASERDAALGDLHAMAEAAVLAAQQLSRTGAGLGASAVHLQTAVRELAELGRQVEFDPAAVAALAEQLECPVCYQFPLPPYVWVCGNGHLLCRSCRRAPGVVTCPTCRGPLGSRPALLLSCWAGGLVTRCPRCHSPYALRDRNQHRADCARQLLMFPMPLNSSPIRSARKTKSWCAGDEVLINGKFVRRVKAASSSMLTFKQKVSEDYQTVNFPTRTLYQASPDSGVINLDSSSTLRSSPGDTENDTPDTQTRSGSREAPRGGSTSCGCCALV